MAEAPPEERQVSAAFPLSQLANVTSIRQLTGRFVAHVPPEEGMRLDVSVGEATGVGDEPSGISVKVPFRLSVLGGRSDDAANGDASSGPGEVLLMIEAEFLLSYSIASDDTPTDEAIAAFANTNAVFNAWPYWREYVASCVGRTGYPALVVPVLRIEAGKLVMGSSHP